MEIAPVEAWPNPERLLEYFSIVEDWESDHGVLDLNDLINDWEMVIEHPVPTDELRRLGLADPIIQSLVAVDATWLALANATPQTIDDEAAVVRLPEWRAFRQACRAAASSIQPPPITPARK